MSSANVYHAVKLNLTEEVPQTIGIWVVTSEDDIEIENLSIADLMKINRLHECHILTLDKRSLKLKFQNPMNKDKHDAVKSIFLTFNDMRQNSSVSLKLQQRGLILHRDYQELRFASSGDNLELIRDKVSKFVVKIKKTVFVEEDPSQTCRNYPTSEFESYTQCDDKYVKKKIEEIAPGKNLTPVWMTENLDTVTSHPLHLDSRAAGKFILSLILRQKHGFLSAKLTDLFFGVDQSDCPLPCVTFSTEVKYLSRMNSNDSGIQLYFLPP